RNHRHIRSGQVDLHRRRLDDRRLDDGCLDRRHPLVHLPGVHRLLRLWPEPRDPVGQPPHQITGDEIPTQILTQPLQTGSAAPRLRRDLHDPPVVPGIHIRLRHRLQQRQPTQRRPRQLIREERAPALLRHPALNVHHIRPVHPIGQRLRRITHLRERPTTRPRMHTRNLVVPERAHKGVVPHPPHDQISPVHRPHRLLVHLPRRPPDTRIAGSRVRSSHVPANGRVAAAHRLALLRHICLGHIHLGGPTLVLTLGNLLLYALVLVPAPVPAPIPTPGTVLVTPVLVTL